MAQKIPPPILILSFIFVTLAAARKLPPFSPIISLQDLQGAHKGLKLEGLHHLKTYLHKFGYLPSLEYDDHDEYFDDKLEIALKLYQQKSHLKPTGILDSQTLSMMLLPRCGVPDFIPNTTTSHMHDHNQHGSSFYNITVSLFNLEGSKWTNMPITYRFATRMSSDFKNAIKQAMKIWSGATNGRVFFEEVRSNEDVTIGFYSGDHGDGEPFDGPAVGGGVVLAHGFFPRFGGDLHFDATENWSAADPLPSDDSVDVETVALHELGHVLGLLHSDDQSAVMRNFYSGGKLLKLTGDDIKGIRSLYGS